MTAIEKAALAALNMTRGIRVEKGAASLPQSTTGNLFTVSGGRVFVLGIYGEVTTVIQTQANATKLIANPTVGSDVDLCATTDITGDAVGSQYGITGTLSDVLQGGVAAVAEQANGVVVPAGTIDLSCAASNTGAVKWTVFYIPLDEGAKVVAA